MKFVNKLNKKYLQISLYVIFTCIVIYCLSLIADHALDIYKTLTEKLGMVIGVLKPIIIGFAFAYVLDGVVSFIERNLKNIKPFHRLRSTRGLAVFITILLVVAFVSLIITLLVYSITDQIKLVNFESLGTMIQNYSTSFTAFTNEITEKLNSLNIESSEINEVLKNAGKTVIDSATSFISGFGNSLSNITGFFSTLFFSIIITIYLLIDGKMIKSMICKISQALFSERINNAMKRFLMDADYVFSGYLKGTLLDVGCMMILISVTLSIVGVKFAVIIGIIAGLGNLIPYCGPFIAYGASAIVCLVNGEITKMVIAIIALIVIQAIDGNIIGPKLLSHSIKVHPLLVIVCLIIGNSIGGLLGMLLAVPVGALIKVIFMRFIDNRLKSKGVTSVEEKEPKDTPSDSEEEEDLIESAEELVSEISKEINEK